MTWGVIITEVLAPKANKKLDCEHFLLSKIVRQTHEIMGTKQTARMLPASDHCDLGLSIDVCVR